MQIDSPTSSEHAAFRAIVNAEIRPGSGTTTAEDDFPLILGEANRPWTLIARSAEGAVAAGLACLTRVFHTSLGDLEIGGFGSVVTLPEFRGQGLSRRLQEAMLVKLGRHKVPLAVLWSDQPEIYAGRGFVEAGWEHHLILEDADLPPCPQHRFYGSDDAEAVAALYAQHRWCTERLPGDAKQLYGMPGTQGLVAVDKDDLPVAAVFCGKGADFPDYVAEWSGEPEIVLGLLGEVRRRGLASRVLVPPGGEALLKAAAVHGCRAFAVPSGLWKILDKNVLAARSRDLGGAPPPHEDPPHWMGSVSEDGRALPGDLHVAVWGFDSV